MSDYTTLMARAKYLRSEAAIGISAAESLELAADYLKSQLLPLPLEFPCDPDRAVRLVRAIGGLVTAHDFVPFLGDTARDSLDAAAAAGQLTYVPSNGFRLPSGAPFGTEARDILFGIARGGATPIADQPAVHQLKAAGLIFRKGRHGYAINPNACKASNDDQERGDWAKGDDS